MNIRVVRFTDVSPERMDELKSRIESGEGPPPESRSTGVMVLFDHDQGTAVVLQHFDTADDLAAGEAYFAGMDPADTPGTRASVDRCEVALDRTA
jgi:hypothetical protein